jgi:uncharacterized membrane protein YgcG
VSSGTVRPPIARPTTAAASTTAPPGARPTTTAPTPTTTPTAPAATAAVAGTAAARFTRALDAHGPDPVRDLPAPYAPLSRALAGGRRVKVSSGPASRAALAAAGHKAATVGTTIHLPTALTTSPEHLDVISHELTHVGAAPTRTAPRFYDDEKHDAEEARARATGRAVGSVARSAEEGKDTGAGPAAPVGTAGLPVGGATNLFQALSSAGTRGAGIGAHRAPATGSSGSSGGSSSSGGTGGGASTGSGTPSGRTSASGLGSIPPDATGPGVSEAPGTLPQAAGAWAPAAPQMGSAVGDGAFRPRRPDELGLPGSVPLGVHDSTVRSGTVLDEAEIRRLVALIERRVLAELERHGRHGPGIGGTW